MDKPSGDFLGGAFIYSGDPGMGILLVPVGAFLLLIAVWLMALAASPRRLRSPSKKKPP